LISSLSLNKPTDHAWYDVGWKAVKGRGQLIVGEWRKTSKPYR
jgi:hypothetical protein